MAFGAGEEIGWGPRIFEFVTPDFLLDASYQQVFNVHNADADGNVFIYVVDASLLLCVVTLSAFFCRKDKLFGIPLPSILLILSFLMIYSYTLLPISLSPPENSIMLKNVIVLFLILIFFTSFSGKRRFCVAAVATLTFVLAHAYTHWNNHFHLELGIDEARKYLFSFACFFYAFELFSVHGWRVMSSGTLLHEKERSDGRGFQNVIRFCRRILSHVMNVRLSMINGTCALIIAGSLGLSVLGYFSPDMSRAAVEEEYLRIKDGEPIIRSVFDVHLIENRLIYLKTPCASSDTRHRFFLHVIPTDADVLPKFRRLFGFEEYSFGNPFFRHDDTHAGRRCMAIIPLPEYDVAGIRTGMDTSRDRAKVWEGRWGG